jgi:hypothetical protein
MVFSPQFVVFTNSGNNEFFTALKDQIIDACMQQAYRNLSVLYHQNFKRETETQSQELHRLKQLAAQKNKAPYNLKEYTGKYKNGVYGDIVIVQENDFLRISFSHHPAITAKLEFLGDQKFLCTYSDVNWGIQEISFGQKEGKIQTITLKVDDFIDYMQYEFIKI